MQEFLAPFVLAGNIVLSNSPRDMFLGGIGQHRALGHVGIVDVGGRRHCQGFGCSVGAVHEFRPVSLAKVPPPDRFPSVDWTSDGVVISDG